MALAHTRKQPFVPLYRHLAGLYREDIVQRRLLPGARMDSINRISARHGVSRETAKKVLSLLVDEGLVVQRAGLGSFVAEHKRLKRLWGVVLPFYSIQYEDLLHRIAEHAWRRQRQLHHFVDYNSWEEEIRLVGDMIARRYEAVIVVPTLDESRTADFYRRLSPRDTFVTLVDHTMAGSFFSYAVQSYDLGVTRAVAYLRGRAGSCRIAFVRNETWNGRNLVEELMEETCRGVLRARTPRSEPVVIDRGRRVDASLIRRENVGGILCCDDVDAVRIIGRLREQGLAVPGDVSVVSYGNTDVARYFTPAVTSIDPHNQEMADTVCAIIDSRRGGKSTRLAQHVVQPELITRET